MKYRYLDFRRPVIQKNLLMRSNLSLEIRKFLVSKDFVEVSILLNNLILSKINAHEKIELAIRINITALTTKSARKKSFHSEKSVAPPSPTA